MFAYFLTVTARARKEEEMLMARLGPAYEAYREKTPRFVPCVRKRSRRVTVVAPRPGGTVATP